MILYNTNILCDHDLSFDSVRNIMLQRRQHDQLHRYSSWLNK